jgi:hypothetical protein
MTLFQVLLKRDVISPIPATTTADLRLDEQVYKPDFEITEKFQSFSKELVRISLLGLGAYGFLIKMAADQGGDRYLEALRIHKVLAVLGVAAFAICASCALLNGFLATKCLAHQLIIARYFGRLDGDRYDEHTKESFRDVIQEHQRAQKRVLRFGNGCLLAATLALIGGGILFAFCSGLVLFKK